MNANSLEVDTNSTAISTNLSNTFYSQVPVARNVGSLFYTAPGVINSGNAGTPIHPSAEHPAWRMSM